MNCFSITVHTYPGIFFHMFIPYFEPYSTSWMKNLSTSISSSISSPRHLFHGWDVGHVASGDRTSLLFWSMSHTENLPGSRAQVEWGKRDAYSVMEGIWGSPTEILKIRDLCGSDWPSRWARKGMAVLKLSVRNHGLIHGPAGRFARDFSTWSGWKLEVDGY